LYVLCIFLPLIGAAIAGLLGPWIKGRGAMIVTCGALLISALISPFILIDVGLKGHPQTIQIFTWISSGAFEVDWALRFDTLTAVMLVVVTVVSCAVHFYSIGYMSHDPSIPRFFSYLSLFTSC
jgi:NADH-quinone oxidoreductase subunit L